MDLRNRSEDAEQVMLELDYRIVIHPLGRPAVSPLITNTDHPLENVDVLSLKDVKDRFAPVAAKLAYEFAYVSGLHPKGRRSPHLLVKLRLCPKYVLNE